MGGAAAFDLTWITPDLAVGGALPPGLAALLAAEHGVTHVIDLREEACDDADELAQAGVRFLQLPTTDLQAPTQDQLDQGAAFARTALEAGGRLLIHCQHGIGRSATLALCVLVERGFDPIGALLLSKDQRELVSPSPAQYEAWIEWMRRHAPEAAMPNFDAFKSIAYRHLAIGA